MFVAADVFFDATQPQRSLRLAAVSWRAAVKARALRDRLRRPIGLDRQPASRLLAAKRSWLAVRKSIRAGVEGAA